jgi:hypothetical protein
VERISTVIHKAASETASCIQKKGGSSTCFFPTNKRAEFAAIQKMKMAVRMMTESWTGRAPCEATDESLQRRRLAFVLLTQLRKRVDCALGVCRRFCHMIPAVEQKGKPVNAAISSPLFSTEFLVGLELGPPMIAGFKSPGRFPAARAMECNPAPIQACRGRQNPDH